MAVDARRRAAAGLTAVAVAAFALRVVYILTVGRRNPDGGDPLYYHVQANLLADGHGFSEPFTWLRDGRLVPSAIHPPLFSLWLAATSVFGGTGFLVHKLAAAVAGTGTVVVAGLLGRRLAGLRAGLLAAGVCAVYPNLWVIDGILMPEGLFAFGIALVLLAAYRFADRPTFLRAAVLGALIGSAALVRSEAAVLGPILAVPLALGARPLGWARRVALVGACGLAAVAVLAPWMVRNLARFDVPVLLSVNGDEVLRNSNCDRTWHGELLGFWAMECYLGEPPPGLDEAERGRWWRDAGLDYVGAHRGRAPVVVAARVGRVWDVWRPLQNTRLSTIEGRNLQVNRWGLGAYYAGVTLAVAGAAVLRRRGERVWPFLSLAVMVTLVAAVAYGVVRFRAPAEVAIVVLAGVALDAALRRRGAPA